MFKGTPVFNRSLGKRSYPTRFSRRKKYSSLIGVALTVLGVIILVFALITFLQNRRSIDAEQFHPSVGFAIVQPPG